MLSPCAENQQPVAKAHRIKTSILLMNSLNPVKSMDSWVSKMNPSDNEPLLMDNPNRFILYPIQHPDIWLHHKNAEASSWTVEEVDLSQDLLDFQQLSDGERHFITNVLALV